MAIVNGYLTLDEAKQWIQYEGVMKQAVLEDLVTETSRAIDIYCDRHFYTVGTLGTPVARTFEATNACRVEFGRVGDLTNVVVPVVETDAAGDGTYETLWAATDYQLMPFSRPDGWPYESIESISGRRFPLSIGNGRRDRVRITGVWGWATVPPGVKQACRMKAAKHFARQQSPNGIAGVGDFGPIRISRFDDPDVADLLDPHRRIAVLVG